MRLLQRARRLAQVRMPHSSEIPHLLRLLWDDRWGTLPGRAEPVVHVESALDWIVNAADAVSKKGVSGGFSLLFGWEPAYLETTGYTIPTLYEAARLQDRPDLRELATNLAEWALKQQRSNGGFPGGVGQTEPPLVFDTGQVLFGLVEAYRQTGRNEFIVAAAKAGAFLSGSLDNEGCYARNLWLNCVHTYDVRVSWALLLLAEQSGEAGFRRAAERNVDWTLSQQHENGLFAHDAFVTGGPIFTHTLGYTLQGLIECGHILGREDVLRSVDRTLSALLNDILRHGRAAGAYDLGWHGDYRWNCLTGDCQLAIVFARAAEAGSREADYNWAFTQVLDEVKKTHRTQSHHPGICGGVKGSHPIYGPYQRYKFPNWAAKFFVDALLIEIHGSAATRG